MKKIQYFICFFIIDDQRETLVCTMFFTSNQIFLKRRLDLNGSSDLDVQDPNVII